MRALWVLVVSVLCGCDIMSDASASRAGMAGEEAHTMALGGDFGCLLTREQVYCWGAGDDGQLGDNLRSSSNRPQKIADMATSSAPAILAVGEDNACVGMADGALWCWGVGRNGILSNEALRDSPRPIQIAIFNGSTTAARAVAVGAHHACAIADDASMWCWGYSGSGQVGINVIDEPDSEPSTIIPTKIADHPSNAEVVDIAAGGYHTCAVYGDGRVSCWGYGEYGQLGTECAFNGDGESNDCAEDVASPVILNYFDGTSASKTASSVDAGLFHTCVISVNGQLYCFGYGASGQLGNGLNYSYSLPQHVGYLRGSVLAVALGEDHSCALTIARRVFCFGDNEYGQLGNGSTASSVVPVEVDFSRYDPHPALAGVAVGKHHSCAWDEQGAWWCWGDNSSGQLGTHGAYALAVYPHRGGIGE